MEQQEPLFDRLGGMDAVNAAVDIFYTKVLADESISHFFTNTNMKYQAGKQKAFLAYAFGCPMGYTGKSMREAHAHMNITEDHFNSVAEHLVSSLEELNVPGDMIDEVAAIALSTKKDIAVAKTE
ncbi:group I truncated hemoglobin [Croceitalea rosinachiae]|uniref:Group 1 truncated hemoglobin n=1 Tax=Croceitalea rosinachiae TaxID=3075596 RepID=A0ABU3A959_9FLAO|nr:group 1 truncated hemoglobin [Croceitalea sp. F388]MDT0606423.1 group 1 truncated hemoglobin [Croceitalea sp. F388]